jgi:hypothetical protein
VKQANTSVPSAPLWSSLPGVLDVWGGGQLFAFSGLEGHTPYHQALAGRTAFEGAGLLLRYPDEAELHFDADRPTKTFLSGDVLDLQHAGGRTRGALLNATHLLIDGPCRVGSRGKGLAHVAKDGRTLVGAAAGLDAALLGADLDAAIRSRLAWIADAPKPPHLAGLAAKTFWKCLSVLKTTVYSPEGVLRHRYMTPDRWPHRGMWLWDSAFQAIGMRHVDPGVARDAISGVLDAQWPDGQVQISYFHRNDRAEYTQPPTLAMAAELVLAAQGVQGREWIAEIYPALEKYLQWDMANRDVDGGGLLEWKIEEHRGCRCGESGWDNSPRFDCALPLDATDFNSLLAIECEAMARFAELLGRGDDAKKWQAHHARLCRLMNERLWSERLGMYVDCEAHGGKQQEYLTASGLLPLACGAPSPERARRMAAHLRDPATMGTPLPLPTLSPSHRDLYSKDMWRGPVWVNVNWLVARGLDRYGLHDDAAMLRGKTLSAIEKYYAEFGAIFEFFDDEDRVPPPQLMRKGPCNPAAWIHQVIHDYGWTAAMYVDLRAGDGK